MIFNAEVFPNNRGITRIEILVLLVTAALLAFILYPTLRRERSSCMDAGLGSTAKIIGYALRDYSDDHHGNLPNSLGELYPTYYHEKKILFPIVDGGTVAITYWHPKRIGDPKTPVVEITPAPHRDEKCRIHTWVLWGDLKVEQRR